MNADARRRAILLYAAYNVIAVVVLFPVIREGFSRIDLGPLGQAWAGVGANLGVCAAQLVRIVSELIAVTFS